jgi:hypothetical protein
MTKYMPVNTRSIVRRIGQKLPAGQVLKSARDNGWFIVDLDRGVVVHHGELEDLARKVKAIEPYEGLANE